MCAGRDKMQQESVQVQIKPLYEHDGRGIYMYIHIHVNSTGACIH